MHGHNDISYSHAVFGQGSGPTHITQLSCTGTEYKLVDCGYLNSNFSHDQDWSVECRNGISVQPQSSIIKLVQFVLLIHFFFRRSNFWICEALPWSPRSCGQHGYH